MGAGAGSLARGGFRVRPVSNVDLAAMAAMEDRVIKHDPLERLLHRDPDGDQAWEELRILLGSRIGKALAGQVSGKSIEEVLADELAEGH